MTPKKLDHIISSSEHEVTPKELEKNIPSDKKITPKKLLPEEKKIHRKLKSDISLEKEMKIKKNDQKITSERENKMLKKEHSVLAGQKIPTKRLNRIASENKILTKRIEQKIILQKLEKTTGQKKGKLDAGIASKQNIVPKKLVLKLKTEQNIESTKLTTPKQIEHKISKQKVLVKKLITPKNIDNKLVEQNTGINNNIMPKKLQNNILMQNILTESPRKEEYVLTEPKVEENNINDKLKEKRNEEYELKNPIKSNDIKKLKLMNQRIQNLGIKDIIRSKEKNKFHKGKIKTFDIKKIKNERRREEEEEEEEEDEEEEDEEEEDEEEEEEEEEDEEEVQKFHKKGKSIEKFSMKLIGENYIESNKRKMYKDKKNNDKVTTNVEKEKRKNKENKEKKKIKEIKSSKVQKDKRNSKISLTNKNFQTVVRNEEKNHTESKERKNPKESIEKNESKELNESRQTKESKEKKINFKSLLSNKNKDSKDSSDSNTDNSEKINYNSKQKEKAKNKDKNKEKEKGKEMEKGKEKVNNSTKSKISLEPQTEKIEYDVGDDIKLKVKWTYIPDKKANIKKGEEFPEKHEKVEMIFTTNYLEKLILHWGVFRAFHDIEWIHPVKESIPENSIEFDKRAIQTEFVPDLKKEESSIRIILSRGKGFETVMGGINFVILEPENNKWYNNFGNNFRIKFRLKKKKSKAKDDLIKRGVKVPDFVDDIIMCETLFESWSLMHRYYKCIEIINTWTEKTPNEDWLWIVIWLRYSHQRQLTWQRYYNTQPSELSRALNRLSMIITNKYGNIILNDIEKEYNNLIKSNTFILKYLLSLLGKGQGNGQAVRDEILVIIHRNRIEPIHTNFYEQWHQKLHNNTTPDDVVICEALLAFLHSGNIEDYWNHLAKGGITKEIMASYDRKITAEPYHNSSYIPDFERYLKLLKSVHSSTDLIETYEQCKYIIGDNYKIDDIIRSRNDIYVLNQIRRVTEGREILQEIIKEYLEDGVKLRDLLFFEISLEIYVRQLVEQILHINLSYQDYIDEISYIIRNIKVSFPNFIEFNLCHEDWFNIVENFLKNDFSKEAAIKVKSVVSRLSRLLSNVIDYYNKNFEPRATYFGNECGLEKFAISTFTEELIRGGIFFSLSMLLKKLEPFIRKNGQFEDWLIISRGKEKNIRGKLIFVSNLNDVQFMKYPEKTIILTENVSGNEEVPINCTGLIIINSENYPDILAHVSVRARNLNTLFAVCFNEEKTKNLMELLNKKVDINLQNQEVLFTEGFYSENDDFEKEEKKVVKIMKVGDKYKKIYLELNEFDNNNVGQKSNNTYKIYEKIPGCDWLKYPESFAIPFNVQEYFMSLGENKSIAEEIKKNIKLINSESKKEIISDLLRKCKDLTMKINFVENNETIQLKNRLFNFGIQQNAFNSAFKAIKSVWASKFNERAFLATSKVGINLNDIKMSVLCQKIIPSDYAFVIHTKNPSNNNPDELFGEICVGMGEALVGAYEGQSLSFEFRKNENKYELKTLPNKSVAIKNSGFIFRSDSNTEDLEGFSGAGLFDSVPMVENKEVFICYHNDKIFFDGRFRDNVVRRVAEIGIAVEKFCGCPQDIEGVFYDNNFYIVQTRPQV